MKVSLVCLAFLLLPFCVSGGAPLQDPWEQSYANTDATGPHVLGCWKFDELPFADASGHGAYLVLQGANLAENGRFGGALTCGGRNDAARHAAVTAKPLARHSPSGAFSAEMWARVSTTAQGGQTACLLDKQGAGMEDFRWSLRPANERGMRQMVVSLGFGSFVKEFASDPVFLPAGEWRHLAFSYDGGGRVAFFVDSQPVGEVFEERCGAPHPGAQALCIGDSLSVPASFPGDIDEVRLCSGVRGFASFSLEITSTSHVWERMARPLPMKITCTNLRRQPLLGANMTFVAGDVEQTFIFPDLEPGASNVNEFGPDTSVKPGSYTLEVVMGKGTSRVSRFQEYQIVARRRQMMPVVMEGASPPDLPMLQALACTHWTGINTDDAPYLGTANKQRPLVVQTRLAAGLAAGLRTVVALDPAPAMLGRGFRRVGRDGKEFNPPALNTSHPEAANFMFACGNMFTIYYRNFSSWTGTWLKQPSRRESGPGFSAADFEAYRKLSGHETPSEIGEGGFDWRKAPGFPQDRMVPDDHPVLAYYRWFWSEGNGWRSFGDAWQRSYERRKQDRPETWVLHDRSVSQPSKAGAYESVMFIADESMDAREPVMAGLCADQQLAMSAAHENRPGVFGVVPLGWERNSAAPVGAKGTAGKILQSDRVSPAVRISMAPAILKESLWMTLSRPVKGIICTDWPALRPLGPDQMKFAVSATHPQSYEAFRDVANQLLLPLGPMLATRQPLRSQVALLESFTSQVMAGRGLYRGASPGTLEVWKALQRAHVQADILYEETLLKEGLEGRRILLLSECDVLPASVVEKIKKWQENGGKVLADRHLCPALKADALLFEEAALTTREEAPDVRNPASGDVEAAQARHSPETLEERIEGLCRGFGWQPPVSCDNPDVILHTSRTGDAMCVFVINGRREAGTYVGQHGLVKEAALPASTILNLGQDSVNVYDLTHSAFILPKRGDNGLTVPLKLGPSQGRVLLLSPSPLLEINLDLPETATCGNVAEARITLGTSGGRPMPAAIPVCVRIRDADGAPAELDGCHVVENGELVLRLELARNETPGAWEVQVRELASGMEAVKWMKVSP